MHRFLRSVAAANAAGSLETAFGTDFTSGILNGSCISITGYTGSSADVVLPEMTGGYTVQVTGAKAFQGNTTLTSIPLPDSIITTEANVLRRRAFASEGFGIFPVERWLFPLTV